MSLLDTIIARSLPFVPKPIVRRVAWRYIAGTTLDDAVRTVQQLQQQGATATIDALGEFVTTFEQAERETQQALRTLDAIATYGLPAYLSVKLTSIGLSFDRQVAKENLQRILEHARQLGLFVRLDMENSPYTTATLDLYRTMREEGFDNIGVVIQAYLYRSEQDIRDLAFYRADIRLCKGIYNEDASIAIKDREGIRQNYRKLLRLIVDLGMRVRIATHDDALITDAERLIAERKLSPDQYEFQMLLGVREQKRQELISRGYPVRVYVPYGEDWYGYSLRRLKENPQIAGHVFRALFHLNGDRIQ
ncbi:MAG: proline dehydrogenase family protein [Bacteroidota bacterium]|nr:proline dehydrogenase family protein [Candidatus Kapabacteria bacterium]MDW8271634.1 proline dehydrogenase family protein [Bacteroidota bacterium]